MSVDPQIYRDIFEIDRRGAAILEELVVRFSRRAVTTGGIDAVLKTYQQEGMRQVVEFIVGQINRANGVPDPNAEQSGE